MLVVINFFFGGEMGRLVDEEVGGVVSVDRLPCFIMCFR